MGELYVNYISRLLYFKKSDNGGGVSVREDEKVMEVDGTISMYLMPLKCTLKNGYNGKVYVYFTTIKKESRKKQSRIRLAIHKLQPNN